MEMRIPSTCNDFTENKELEFYHILFQLGKLECSYLSYSLEMADGNRFNFFADKEWHHIYQTEGFIKTCPLTIHCRTKGNTIIPWNTLLPINLEQKRVLDARSDFDIAHGITIAQKINGTYEMIAFATRRSNPKFIEIVRSNKNFIQTCLLRLRKIAVDSHNL